MAYTGFSKVRWIQNPIVRARRHERGFELLCACHSAQSEKPQTTCLLRILCVVVNGQRFTTGLTALTSLLRKHYFEKITPWRCLRKHFFEKTTPWRCLRRHYFEKTAPWRCLRKHYFEKTAPWRCLRRHYFENITPIDLHRKHFFCPESKGNHKGLPLQDHCYKNLCHSWNSCQKKNAVWIITQLLRSPASGRGPRPTL